MAERQRLEREARREQVIEATLALVAQYGVRGTTLARIAEAVGVTTPALYAHFANRHEILSATLELVFKRISTVHQLPDQDDALEKLREIGRRHTRLVADDGSELIPALFEFIAAPPAEGLRETLGANHLVLVEDLAAIVREGQQQGSIIPEADPEEVAWLMVSRAWTEDVSQLMGTTEGWSAERSERMLELILGSIAAPGREEPGAAAPGGKGRPQRQRGGESRKRQV